MKDFNSWNIKKQAIDNKTDNRYFREGDIWWTSIGINIGEESNGKGDEFRRPVLVYKKLSGSLCIAIPLSSKQKHGTWFENISFLGE